MEFATFQKLFLLIMAFGFALNAYEIYMFRKDLFKLEELAEEEEEENADNK